MATDRDFKCRMDGMIYALKIAQEQGIDELAKEIKRRGCLRADLPITRYQYEVWYNMLSANIGNNMYAVMCYILNQHYGFGKKRLDDFKKKYDEAVDNCLDLDYMGEHYVKLEDYAIELNKKYDLGIDVSLSAASQDSYDSKDTRFRDTKLLDGIINTLKLNGYYDAADFLEAKKTERTTCI